LAAPVFLSYSWEDMAEVDDLDELLRFRGLPVWRDRRAMRWGGYNEDLVRRVILAQVSGFVVYLTPAALESWFVPEVELRAMDKRRSHNSTFFSGAVFRGYGVKAGTEAVYERAHVDIGATLGSEVGERELFGALREAANAIAREYYAAQWAAGPATVKIETRNPLPVADEALLHLSLSPPLAHDPDTYEVGVWDEKIAPALADLEDALHTVQLECGDRERVLEVGGAAHLSAALALGFAFREPTRWSLRIRHHDDVWETKREPAKLDGWDVPSPRAGSGRDGDLVVMVHATADVREATRASAGGLARAELHFTPPGGPDKLSLDPATANAAAAGIAKAIREARAAYAPKETRLYLASPWPFAALLGWHLGSCGPVVMHEANVARDSYRVSVVLRG
jgi:hypothetical protein